VIFHYYIDTLPNDITDSDDVSVDLVIPCIEITKTPDVAFSKVGDTITYKICVTNCGDATLENIVVTDPMLGGTLTEFSSTLAAGASECYDYCYVVQPGDLPGPVFNCVIVHSNPVGLTNDITDTDCTDVPLIEPCISVDKMIWDPDTQDWVETLSVTIGTDLFFKINITNCGDVDLTGIVITDTMSSPQLEYRDNANLTEHYVSPDLRTVIWRIPILHVDESIEITFHAESVNLCFGWNNVYVTTSQGVSDEDLVPVKTWLPGPRIVNIKKLVWQDNSDSWVETITKIVGTELTFSITVKNNATSIVHDVIVTDNLPDNIVYIETLSLSSGITIVSETPHQVIWDLGNMSPSEVKEIIYKVKIVSEGLDDNEASVTTSEYYNDIDSVLIKAVDFPIVQLIYPKGGEQLSDTATVEWYAADTNENLKIYLFYSNNDGGSWRRLKNEPLENNIDQTHGDYKWDTTKMSDGEFLLKVEAVNILDGITMDTSDPFTVDNDYKGVRVSDVRIRDITIDSSKWVKDGDAIEISAGITGSISLTREDITADFSGFNMGTVVAESYDGFNVKWILYNVVCNPSNGPITVTVYASDIDSNSATITADNTNPELNIDKPQNGLYFFNNRFLPLSRTVILGPMTIKLDVSDNLGVNRAEFYLDDELMYADTTSSPE